MIEIKSDKLNYGINFPTSIYEITSDDLKHITSNVKLPKHYCIVALAFTTKLFDFCTAINSNRSTDVSVTPILAKISEDDVHVVNANVGDKLIVNRSSLERGVHINLKTVISSNVARNYFNSDQELIKNIVTKNSKANINKDLVSDKSPNIVVLEFKILPVTDISASVPIECDTIDPFIVAEGNRC